MGLPLAVSKTGIKYDQRNYYHTVKQSVKNGIVFYGYYGSYFMFYIIYIIYLHLAELVIDGKSNS